jgi:hypothetical protein
MTFDALKRAKTLELQDKMRNYASEAVQVIYNAKDTDWEKVFGNSGVLPPGTANAVAYLDYPSANELPEIKLLDTNLCNFQASQQTFTGECIITSGNERGTNAASRKIFGRLIRRIDYNNSLANTTNHAQLEIIVACIDKRCDPTVMKPFKLTLDVYRTSAPR